MVPHEGIRARRLTSGNVLRGYPLGFSPKQPSGPVHNR